jgi:hypothetical protein
MAAKKRATAKRRVNRREQEAAAQSAPKRGRGRHGKDVLHGERSTGVRRGTSQGTNEQRGGRERTERRGSTAATGPARGQARHPKRRGASP